LRTGTVGFEAPFLMVATRLKGVAFKGEPPFAFAACRMMSSRSNSRWNPLPPFRVRFPAWRNLSSRIPRFLNERRRPPALGGSQTGCGPANDPPQKRGQHRGRCACGVGTFPCPGEWPEDFLPL